MAWTLVVCDRQGVPLGDLLNAHDRKFTFTLNRVPTLAFTINPANARAVDLLQGDKTLLKAYDDASGSKVLQFLGPVITVQKVRQPIDSGPSSIAVTAAGVGWRLGYRLLGKDKTGFSLGSPTSLTDRGAMAHILIATGNTDGDTGVRVGTITASSNTYVGPWYFKNVLEGIQDLSGTLDGYDWRIDPNEPTPDSGADGVVGPGLKLGTFTCAAALSTSRPNAIFEFGAGKRNVTDFTHAIDSTGLANDVYGLPSGYPDTATLPVSHVTDSTSITDRGLYQASVDVGLSIDDLLSKTTSENLRLRKVPRETITFTPTRSTNPTTPRYGVDYTVGDIVTFRATELFPVYDQRGAVAGQKPVQTVNATFRVYAVELTLDNEGAASPVLTLVPGTA